ncbi:hypothetical protein SAURM35S_04829 [Streptomyces aurantiogriseus]
MVPHMPQVQYVRVHRRPPGPAAASVTWPDGVVRSAASTSPPSRSPEERGRRDGCTTGIGPVSKSWAGRLPGTPLVQPVAPVGVRSPAGPEGTAQRIGLASVTSGRLRGHGAERPPSSSWTWSPVGPTTPADHGLDERTGRPDHRAAEPDGRGRRSGLPGGRRRPRRVGPRDRRRKRRTVAAGPATNQSVGQGVGSGRSVLGAQDGLIGRAGVTAAPVTVSESNTPTSPLTDNGYRRGRPSLTGHPGRQVGQRGLDQSNSISRRRHQGDQPGRGDVLCPACEHRPRPAHSRHRFRLGRPQPTAFLTSALMRCSSAAVNSFRA